MCTKLVCALKLVVHSKTQKIYSKMLAVGARGLYANDFCYGPGGGGRGRYTSPQYIKQV